ncbi:MAG: (d)CMP kinase [Lachnospiraceae bacterium]|nr:(d)CMP kinase [Lachnospiraceae bacterium]
MKLNSIAIDGPAGAGKSTIARKVAGQLGFIYVDTGAMYRAMALFMEQNHIDPSDQDAVSRACRRADISIAYQDGGQVTLLDGVNVNAMIRTEQISQMASVFSANGDVRRRLVELQQKLAQETPVVMDGRDIGTVVLPDAVCKIYLTASVRVRAERRLKEDLARGMQTTLEKLEQEIAERDERDSNRAISPLRQADDAVLLDTSDLTIEEVTDKILACYRNAAADEGLTV